MSDYQRALDWIFSFAHFDPPRAHAQAPDHLERMRALLDRLGNPHERFWSVHIAGTKGKGSTAAMCESILRAANIRTGLYTSPHLHSFRERIRVAGELIPEREVVEGVERLREIQPILPGLIVFDLITALAFDYFARSGVEGAVVEVGLGGRLDSTNVITPRVAVITSISFDHPEVLGNSLFQIAREKAGIIKRGIPVVSAPQGDEARGVIEQVARERDARLVQVGRDWQWDSRQHTLDYQEFDANSHKNLRLHLLGTHQLENATNALAAINLLAKQDSRITEEAVRQGIFNTRWPGRFEIVQRDPFVVLDGAHNRDSARVLVNTLRTLLPKTQLQWLFGASIDKDIRGIFAELLTYSPALILTRSRHPRAADPQTLATLAHEMDVEPTTVATIPAAVQLAQERMRAGDFDATVITGSLFVVADARELILRQRGVRLETDSQPDT